MNRRAWAREIGRELRAMRTEAGLSLRDLGDRAGWSRKTVNRVESGAYLPGVDALARYAEACGYRLEIRFEPTETP